MRYYGKGTWWLTELIVQNPGLLLTYGLRKNRISLVKLSGVDNVSTRARQREMERRTATLHIRVKDGGRMRRYLQWNV